MQMQKFLSDSLKVNKSCVLITYLIVYVACL